MIIVDTNILSELMRRQPDPRVVSWLNGQDADDLWTTAIVTMEIRYGLAIMEVPDRRALLEQAFERLQETLFADRILPFDDSAARQTAQRQAQAKREGLMMEYRDSMIAGVALSRGATLATRNLRHFSDAGIRLVNPFEAGQKL